MRTAFARLARLAALSLAALLPATAARAVVVAGPIENPANGHAYYLLEAATWTAAESEAQALGGHLVAIGDADENAWVWSTFSAIGGAPFWIGLTDAAQEGTFVWSNGEPVVYTSWWTAGGEPNNAGGVEHYAELNNGVWNDNAGGNAFRAIAELQPEFEFAFEFVEAEATPAGPQGASTGVVSLAVSPDDQNVYALLSVSPGDDFLLVYARGGDGSLTPIDAQGVDANPTALAVAPDGSALFAVTNNGALAAWRRSAATGLLTFADLVYDGIDGGSSLQFAYGVAVSPDSKHVYVASGENAVTTFAWDGAAGVLTLRDLDLSGVGPLLLSAPGPIAVTPDGVHVLVASQGDASLVAFTRDAALGFIDFAARFTDGASGVDGLDAPFSLAVAPTAQGSAAYVSSFESELAVFAQSSAGGVSFAQALPIGMLQPSLAISHDGTRIYLGDRYASRVSAYERDPDTGAVGAFVAAIADSDPGVDGLAEVARIAVAPDGRHVYAASWIDGAIAVLATPAPEPGATAAGAASLLALAAARRRYSPR